MSCNIDVVILCGGKGTRMNGVGKSLPKPMVKIGGKPILWHVMKIYSYYGFNNLILCLGNKANKIKEYFKDIRGWNITFAYTGLNTNTGGRIKKIEKYVNGETFFATYADGLADIDLSELLEYHKRRGKIATITVVKPRSPFGVVELDSSNLITSFIEKPVYDHWINGGFFVFNKDIFDYIGENDTLEREPFEKLVKNKEICAYIHQGFWKCMDTYKDNLELKEMWRTNEARWAIWKKGER